MLKNIKICPSCKKKKSRKQFTLKPGTKWINGYCKECMVKRTIKWIKENREKYNKYQREYRKKHYVKKNKM